MVKKGFSSGRIPFAFLNFENQKMFCNILVKNSGFPYKMYKIVHKKTTIPTCIFKVNRLE